MAKVKVCRKHKTVKVRSGPSLYCRECKREHEKKRYDRDPDSQRTRKRKEYHSPKPTGGTVTTASTQCEHDDALLVEESDLHESKRGQDLVAYFCPDEGIFINQEGKQIPDPTEADGAGGTQAGKVSAPRKAGRPGNPSALARRGGKVYKRDVTLKIPVPCSWPNCKVSILMYPQNRREKNWCPQKHRPLVRIEQGKLRQRKFRQKPS